MRWIGPSKGSITPKGYRRMRVKGRGLRFEHVLVWESHHGPIPSGMQVHHRNGDKLDNRIENLRLLTPLEHKRHHSGCIKFGDRWLKRCKRCRWFRLVDTEFYVYPGRTGAYGTCIRCTIDVVGDGKQRRTRRAKEGME